MDIQKFIDKVREEFFLQKSFIPLHDPRFIGNEKKYMIDCIDTNFVSSAGEYVGKFEKMVAEYCGANYAVAAMNGTAALHICLILAGVKKDEEVITQALTFIATANAITYTGAKCVFIDVDKDTMGLSPLKVEAFLNKFGEKRTDGCYNKLTGRRIAAIMPMHTFGAPVRLDDLKEICDKWNIPMVEDAAESIGSFYKGKHTGNHGLLSALSFNGNKIITCGGGGIILTNDENLAKKAKHITTTAKIPHPYYFVHDMVGYNYRMTNISAALGCAQMENLSMFVEKKRELAKRYIEFFKDIDNVEFFAEPKDTKSNYWLNAIILTSREERDIFLNKTNDEGIMTRPIWTLMNKLKMYKDCQTDGLEDSQWLEDRVVNIPSAVPIKGYFNE